MANELGVYAVLEKLIKQAKEPVTCVDLFDHQEVKKYADSTSRVSDFVGHMWRRGLLQRWTAPRTLDSKARFAYTWKENEATPTAAPLDSPVERITMVRSNYAKPNVTITEEESSIVLDFEQFTITVQRKI